MQHKVVEPSLAVPKSSSGLRRVTQIRWGCRRKSGFIVLGIAMSRLCSLVSARWTREGGYLRPDLAPTLWHTILSTVRV